VHSSRVSVIQDSEDVIGIILIVSTSSNLGLGFVVILCDFLVTVFPETFQSRLGMVSDHLSTAPSSPPSLPLVLLFPLLPNVLFPHLYL
jgi:hypothetical protein